MAHFGEDFDTGESGVRTIGNFRILVTSRAMMSPVKALVAGRRWAVQAACVRPAAHGEKAVVPDRRVAVSSQSGSPSDATQGRPRHCLSTS
jgi:hypothetical protein